MPTLKCTMNFKRFFEIVLPKGLQTAICRDLIVDCIDSFLIIAFYLRSSVIKYYSK